MLITEMDYDIHALEYRMCSIVCSFTETFQNRKNSDKVGKCFIIYAERMIFRSCFFQG